MRAGVVANVHGNAGFIIGEVFNCNDFVGQLLDGRATLLMGPPACDFAVYGKSRLAEALTVLQIVGSGGFIDQSIVMQGCLRFKIFSGDSDPISHHY